MQHTKLEVLRTVIKSDGRFVVYQPMRPLMVKVDLRLCSEAMIIGD